MKKLHGVLIITLLSVTMLVAGCNVAYVPQENTTVSEHDPKQTGNNIEVITGENDVYNIINCLIPQAFEIFWWYYGTEDTFYYTAGSNYETKNILDKVNTIAALRSASEDIFTYEFCQNFLYPFGFEKTANNTVRFQEKDGFLVVDYNAIFEESLDEAYNVAIMIDDFEIVEMHEKSLLISVHCADFVIINYEFDFVFEIVLEGGLWKLNNWPIGGYAGSLPFYTLTEETFHEMFSDLPENPTKNLLECLYRQGAFVDFNGVYSCEALLTRAQLAAVIKRYFGYNTSKEIVLNDILPDAIICEKMVQLFQNDRPDDIAKYVDAVEMLALILKVESKSLKQQKSTVDAGITFLEFADLLNSNIELYINQFSKDEYDGLGRQLEGNVVINRASLTLSNLHIKGNLYVMADEVIEKVADGQVVLTKDLISLNNVKIDGNLFAMADTALRKTELNQVEVIDTMYVCCLYQDIMLQNCLIKHLNTVYNAPGLYFLYGTQVEDVMVNSTYGRFSVDDDSIVQKICIAGDTVILNIDLRGNLFLVENNSQDVLITFGGTIQKLQANVDTQINKNGDTAIIRYIGGSGNVIYK
jgi:hypothetical protein